MKLYLLRHGKTVANERNEYCGSTDSPLSQAGKEELLQLKEQYDYTVCENTVFYTSGLTRTEETLQLLLGDVPHIPQADFKEMNFGIFEGKTYEELKELPAYQTWITGDNEANVCPGGESGNQQTARVCRAVDRLIDRGENALLVSHGGTTTAIMQHLFPGEGKNRYQWKPEGGRGYRITIENGSLTYEPFPKEKQ